MNKHLRAALLVSVALLGTTVSGTAGDDSVTPVPDPTVGAAPAMPTGAQETYDEVSIKQLMKIVELSRVITGGISQIFGSTQDQKQALGQIRDAQTGPKTIPVLNGATEAGERDGGPGLNEMADAALEGSPIGPVDIADILSTFQTSFNLDKAFALKDDPSLSKAMGARAAAKGAIATAMAEISYKRANASMARLDSYITALGSSADLKTSVDINTRVMVEVAQQLNESLRTQAELTSIAGTYFMIVGGEAAKDDDLSALIKFNR
ncbi:type IV secretion system protein [Mesorhizobium sp. GbtcB19]|uniref:type IV secretion system protein n=1 Tax=Mesorhizobium sp. GbtcB19 TaxID=2824764 RepID=UPI001C310661|nr:type IV secretion system protein [Mesorhizobium sp. GbtcB19]